MIQLKESPITYMRRQNLKIKIKVNQFKWDPHDEIKPNNISLKQYLYMIAWYCISCTYELNILLSLLKTSPISSTTIQIK